MGRSGFRPSAPGGKPDQFSEVGLVRRFAAAKKARASELTASGIVLPITMPISASLSTGQTVADKAIGKHSVILMNSAGLMEARLLIEPLMPPLIGRDANASSVRTLVPGVAQEFSR